MVLRISFLVVLFSALLLTGCGSKLPRLHETAKLHDEFQCSFAVLPFVNITKFPRGSDVLYKTFVAELQSYAGFHLISEGDIRDVYRELKIFTTQPVTQEEMRIIGNRLSPQYFISSDLLSLTQRQDSSRVIIEMAFVVEIFDGKTGKRLWSTYHKRNSSHYDTVLHFGRVNTVVGLAQVMTQEILDLWFSEGMNTCIDM